MKGNIYMNKNIIEINNNQYAVSDEAGNIRIINTKNIEDKSLIEEVFIKENDIEQLEKELTKNKEILKNIKSNTIWGEIFNILTYISLIVLYLLIPFSKTGQLIIIGHTYLLLKSFNCISYGTRLGRFIKKKKAKNNIENIEPYLIKLRNELEQLKIELKYTELTPNLITEQKNNYSYEFQTTENNSNNLEPAKTIQALKLTRKPTKELLNNKIEK